MQRIFVTGLSLISLSITSCASDEGQDNLAKSVIACAIGGGITYAITGNTKKAVAGCVVGGLVTALALNAAEQKKTEEARNQALDTNQRVNWQATNVSYAPSTPLPEATNPEPLGPYTARHRKYCTTHRSYCARMDENERRRGRVVKSPPKPQPKPVQVVTATGYVIPISTNVNAKGETCRRLEEHGEKNGKTADTKVTYCRASTGWVVA